MSQADRVQTDRAAFWFAAGAATVAVAIWVALTARTGVTYHLFPFVVAASVGVMGRLGGPPLRRREAVVATAGGVVAVALGWLLLVVLDETPTATFGSDQPGGVPGETAVFALLGATFGWWWVTRRR